MNMMRVKKRIWDCFGPKMSSDWSMSAEMQLGLLSHMNASLVYVRNTSLSKCLNGKFLTKVICMHIHGTQWKISSLKINPILKAYRCQ